MSTDEDGPFLLIMTMVHMINDGFEMVVPTLLPVIAVSLDLSYSQIGIVSGAMVLAMGVGQGFVGVGSDLLGHKKHLIVLGVVASSTGFCLMGASEGYHLLLAGSMLIGLGLSIYHPVSMAIITNRFTEARGRAVGIHGSGGNTGMFLFPLAAGLLADVVGWRETLFIFPIIGMSVITVYSIKVKDDHVRLGSFEPRKLLVPALAVIIISIGLFSMATRGFFTYFPVALSDLGMSSSSIGSYFSVFFGIGIIGQYLGGMVSDRHDNVLALFVLLVVGSISMFTALQHPQGWVLVASIIVSGLSVNMIWPLFFVLYAKKTPPDLRGAGFGFFFSIIYLFAASAPILMGQLGTWYSSGVANGLVLVTGVAGAFVLVVLRKR